MSDKLKVLVVDDESDIRKLIKEYLSSRTFTIIDTGSPTEALRLLGLQEIDLLLLDIQLPGKDGIELLKEVRVKFPTTEVIMVSGLSDVDKVLECIRLGATDYIRKPFDGKALLDTIKRTRKYADVMQQDNEIKKTYSILSKTLPKQVNHQIIGKSKQLKQVVDLMMKVAKTDDTSVLITGESGTGKELIARGIHYLSARNKKTFYDVNCCAVPESLFESEFMGHSRGAFTGAVDNRMGWFEISHQGTLFLDEIGDMPMHMQTKMLRVLEYKKIRKLGSSKEVPTDVRVISATNQNLETLFEKDRFRRDLYYRLSNFVIHIPPLRERIMDIPLLLEYYSRYFATKNCKKIEGIDQKVINAMMHYEFPGNVRELRNMVERAVILCDGGHLKMKHFTTQSIRQNIFDNTNEKPVNNDAFDLELNEKMLIIGALRKTRFNKTNTARLLNISRQALDRRIKKL